MGGAGKFKGGMGYWLRFFGGAADLGEVMFILCKPLRLPFAKGEPQSGGTADGMVPWICFAISAALREINKTKPPKPKLVQEGF